MKVIEFYNEINKDYWIEQIEKSDWGAGKYLASLLKGNRLKELCGKYTRVFMLVDDLELISFLTLAQMDDIQPTKLTPWIGFVYTFTNHRGNRYAERLIKHAEIVALNDGYSHIYISTNHTGLYEKYGYEFYKMMKDIEGEDSKVYIKKLSKED